MTALGWVIALSAYCVVAVTITLARKKSVILRRVLIGASVAVYLVLASLGYALAFNSVPEGIASALVSLVVTLPLLGIRSSH